MSEGLFSKHSSLNAGAIPASAEELSQRYTKLFQQYSRLKAQHAVLKKAVIKEQATNVALQGNLKEKEKELRKLQEQLDLLSFHNERLTKRIQAVQESDQKGNHFSILGGSVKKELAKSTQALDAASLDLEQKIKENERLHEELTERKLEFTDGIHALQQQIKDLEQRVQELQVENTQLNQSNTGESSTQEAQPEQSLKRTIDELQFDLSQKTQLLEELEQTIQQNDGHLLSEIRSLRTILLAKVGDIENTSLKDVLSETSLKTLEDEANNYIHSIGNNTLESKMTSLPHGVAEKLKISHETWREEFVKVSTELQEKKKELDEFLERARQGQDDASLFATQIKEIYDKNDQEIKQLDEKHKEKRNQANARYEEQLKEYLATKEDSMNKIQQLEMLNDALKKENTKLEQEIDQIHTTKPLKVDNETQTDAVIEKEENMENVVYPKEEQEEDEEAFVYTGVDAQPSAVKQEEKKEEKKEKGGDNEENVQMLKLFYEQKIKNMTEKLQKTDSKVVIFAEMYKKSKEKLASEEKDKQMMMSEIERLNNEVKRIQDVLTTEESNHLKQINLMTEYIASMQK
ncbi:hypothetical protein G6F46_002198 [Rhizopus delemar]|nr:hypothetical protein G6F55_001215 [Rhizopus delemar]KAG1554188.1 hypothetical protein G6F51_000108 [Rhizopus arrhizus]KAG1503652.1 hypothetical protein G6F54_001531 [Rhizopus delemar]KAG1518214.1 hypothetical protein G6F53_000766 [Rhizopus delemar]KAG1527847.1 hypothetical protein G6F52_001173 [Rhizopus delemar]